MELSQLNKAIILAKEKGYYSDKLGNIFSKTGRRLKLSEIKAKNKKNKYLKFTIKCLKSRNCKNIPVHRFIAYLKFGETLFIPGLQVRHLNENSKDNSWENIELGTMQQNSLDRPRQKRIDSGKHAASFLKILTDDQVRELRKDRINGYTYTQLMKKYNIKTKHTISSILKNRTYTDVV